MRGDERRRGRREACRCTSVNGGDGWRPACNSDAFLMVWVEGIRLGGPEGEFGCGGTMRRVPAWPACRSSVLGSVPARWVSLGYLLD